MNGECPFAEQIRGVTSFSSGAIDRVGFCDHTAGGFMQTMRNPGFWNGAGVSTHFAVGRDGSIIQMVNIFDTAFAQGRLGPVVAWPPYAAMNRGNPNGYLISTEHEDAETVNGQTVFVPGAAWTEAQFNADLRLKRWCVEEVARAGVDLMRFGIDSLTGHYMFDGVNRANCPGPSWKNEYRQRLYNGLTLTGETPVDPNDPEYLELADRRAASLVSREINWQEGDGLYRPVSVHEEGELLYVEFWNPDRTRPANPLGVWVRKPV